MEEGLKCKIWALGPEPLTTGILPRMRWDLPRSIHIPNLKLLAITLLSNLDKGVLKFKNSILDPD